MVVHCCTRGVLTLDAVTITMLGLLVSVRMSGIGWEPELGAMSEVCRGAAVWGFLLRTAWNSVCLWLLLQLLGKKSEGGRFSPLEKFMWG